MMANAAIHGSKRYWLKNWLKDGTRSACRPLTFLRESPFEFQLLKCIAYVDIYFFIPTIHD
jgi:hypothetical protein